jgi:hypothetical protein
MNEVNEKIFPEGGSIFYVMNFPAGARGTATYTAASSRCSVSLTHKVGEDATVVQ